MFQKLLALFISLILLSTTTTFAAKPTPPKQTTSPRKQKLVLIPIVLSDSELKLRGQIETSLVSGLQERYVVFSGENVLQKHREIMTKESKESKGLCDETKCMQDLAEGFGSELVAVVHVTKEEGNFFTSGRYILSINVQNIFDNKAVYNKVIMSKSTDTADLLDKLQELGRGDAVSPKAPEVITPSVAPVKEEKPIQATKADAENELWSEAQKGNSIEDYSAYLEAYPKGKYSTLAKARIKKFKAEQTVVVQSSTPTPQKQATVPTKTTTSKDVFYDKSTGLMWQDNEDVKNILLVNDWQGAKEYCENLTLAGRTDWKLPTKKELISLSTLGFFGDYDSGHSSWYDANKGKLINDLFSNPALKNDSYYYWSSSPDVSDSANAWGVYFNRGYAYSSTKSGSGSVRCVRR